MMAEIITTPAFNTPENSKAKIIDSENLIIPKEIVGYVFLKEEEIEAFQNSSEPGQVLEDLNIEPGDCLYLFYEDSSDKDDDFDYFEVFEGEKAFAIRIQDQF